MQAQTDIAHAYLLERCLRLEGENALLREQMSERTASCLVTQAIIRLHDERHLPFRAIGVQLGLSEGATYKRYAAAHRRTGSEGAR